MKADSNLYALRKCISNAGQAIVYRYFDERHKQALGLKRSLEIDENGCLYYTMNTQFEEKFTGDRFLVEVFVHKKGEPFYILCKGLAEKLPDNPEKNICITMDSVEMIRH